MSNRRHLPSISVAFLALAVSVSGTGFVLSSQEVAAQQAKSKFPDVPQNYWARPFIQSLAEKDIVTGYVNGTFRPKQAVDRDEFSAMIRQAFNRASIRKIPSGSYFKDVPKNYWAETPIQEAYEAGFMNDFPGNEFRPKQPLTKAQALVVLMRGLNMDYNPPVVKTDQAAATPARQTPVNQRRKSRNRLAFPFAATVLMQPLLPVVARLQPAAAPAPKSAKTVPPTTTKAATAPGKNSALDFLKSYYKDAGKIPKEAVEPVAAATKAKIVVNYPDPRVLNPNELLSRGSATALIHQALVNQGQIEPLPDKEAAKYIPNSPRR
ncbi:S-layer homology domain-containing protein [Microcoleus vaginatus]|uniref:S-layer homology domain-containing protein n=1 Tax=Microcoleus vaginatus TaxID=119532 RepID=UPI001F607451|nr:S-layer homology domain-containing protein [Microcoleus vaginatus HSN003]